MEEQVNPLEIDHTLTVVLPGGLEKSATVHGSKPVMDLLVTLCASYHLNPSDYAVEFLSPNKNNINFKPNSPIGSLEAEKIVLKPKGVEEKIRRPYMPEASVRLLINYNKAHKAVVRVSPRVPLGLLLPVVCDKCEFNVETTILLRDSQSNEELDLNKTLNEHGLREVFARDTAEPQHQPKTPEAAVSPTEVISPPPPQELPKREKKQKENRGFLSLFRGRKKKPEGAVIPPASPGHNTQVGVSMNGQSSNGPPVEMPKKRRAPQPPMGASLSVPNNLSNCHLRGPQRSAESTLRSTKRRAPPPPCSDPHQELQADTDVKGIVDSLSAVEELRESDESDSVNLSLSSSSSPHPSHPRSSSSCSRPSFAHLHEIADPYLPSFRGKDLSDARSALAKVLTSSVSKGALVKRLRNSTTFPKLNGSSFMSMPQRSSGNGVFCAEPEPVVTSNLPTEPEWEDPAQRKGMTTFKVVPSKQQKSHEPLLFEVVPDQYRVEDNPESECSSELVTHQIEFEDDPPSQESPSPSPEPSAQETEASPPPPVDSDDRDCPGSPRSDVEETKQNEEEEPEVTSEVIPAETSDCSDEELPQDGQISVDEQSEILQSPRRQSVSTDVEPCASNTEESEVEEVVQEEEKEKEGEEEEEKEEGEEEEEEEGEEEEKEEGEEEEKEVEEEEKEVEEVNEEEDEDIFPPPPSPVFFNEGIDVTEDIADSSLPSSLPPSPTPNGQPNTLSEDHQSEPSTATPDQSAAAPVPPDKMSTAPSRFAQAVALAVQRSRLQRHLRGLGSQAPSGPHSALPSPPRTTYQFGA